MVYPHKKILIYPEIEDIIPHTKALRGRSSVWLERQIVDLKVAGSTPVVPATTGKPCCQTAGFFVGGGDIWGRSQFSPTNRRKSPLGDRKLAGQEAVSDGRMTAPRRPRQNIQDMQIIRPRIVLRVFLFL